MYSRGTDSIEVQTNQLQLVGIQVAFFTLLLQQCIYDVALKEFKI